MFGFIGKQQGEIIVESNGLPSTNRYFDVYFGSEIVSANQHNRLGFMLFDIENVSATKPDNTQKDTLDPYGIETSPRLVGTWNEASQIGNRLFDETYLNRNATVRGWQYNGTSTLSPPTRKFKFVLPDPDVVEVISISPRTNNQGRTSTNNNGTGTLTLNLNLFRNLTSITLNEMWVDTLNFNADLLTKLEIVDLTELLNLSVLNGKIPSSVKKIKMGAITPLSNINDFISEAVNCEVVQLGHWAPTPNFLNTYDALTGNFDIAHMTNLKELALGSSSLSSISLPTLPANNWRIFMMWLCNTLVASIADSDLDSVLGSSNLEFFGIHQSNRLWTKDFVDADISPSLIGLYLYSNRITGDLTITNPKTALKDLRLGISQSELNRFANIDLTGLNGGALTTLHLQGVECSNLTLPASLPNLTSIVAYDNKFDTVTNTDLITKINGYTSLTTLDFSSTGSILANVIGQNSTNGLGDVDISGLVNLTIFYAGKCKITSLTLPNVNKLTNLEIGDNPALTGITNLNSHTGLIIFRALSCSGLTATIGSSFTALTDVRISKSLISSIDLSGKNTTSQLIAVVAENCPNLTTVTYPTTQARARYSNSNNCIINDNPLLTTLVNFDQINYNSFGNNGVTITGNDILNVEFPFGINNFIPSIIAVNDNALDTSNVDGTLDNIFANKTKWSLYLNNSKSLNIGGTNSYATGLYEAPSGFIQGSADGTPTTAAEQIYVLVNNYAWTITFNAQIIAGVHWSIVSGSYSALWSSVAYNNGIFVAVAKSGGGDRTMYSLDSGATWTMRTSPTNYWMWVTYGNGLFVAVGADGSNRVMTSPDGINWTGRLSAGEFNQWSSVTYGNGLFVAVASGGVSGSRVMTSTNGTSWTSRTSASDNAWNSVAYGNGMFVAVASSGSGNDRVMSSTDGITWTGQTSAADNDWQGVTYGNGLFVAVASSGTGDRVMTSPDGINWTIRTSAADNNWKSVTYGSGLFVAVSTTGTGTNRVMTSPDGINWTIRTSAGTINNEWQGITYGNGQFIAVSHASSNWIMKSP